MSPEPYQFRQIMCEVCGRHCRAEQKDRDICRTCLRKEPSVQCVRCERMTHRVVEETGFVPVVPICLLAQRQYALTAHALTSSTIRRSNSVKLVRKVDAGIFGPGTSRPKWHARCAVRRARRHYSVGLSAKFAGRGAQWSRDCSGCNRLKVIQVKAERLCKHCHQDRLAPKLLRSYVMGFTSPYPYNQTLFDLLVSTIDWESVSEKTKQRFHTFGRFLQTQQLNEPLTWETIEEALPPLGPTNRHSPKQIRACLLDLGYLLADKGKLETREAYIARRNALLPIKQAPEHIQALLHRFTLWLWERRTVPSNVRDYMEALASFWSWCEQHGIRSPEEVHAGLLNNYLLTLYWQWQCSVCERTMAFEPGDRKAPRVCIHCSTIGSLTKEKRHAQNTVRGHRAKLLVFFDWLKINRLVVANPVQGKTPAPAPTIQHYPSEVIKRLCTYITTPDADPVEAVIVYLIIFHALSVWELQHAQLPTVFSLRQDIPPPRLAEAYYVIVPKPAPSLGDRSPGRPDVRLDFPAKAAPWLKPLLERFERQREQMISDVKEPLSAHCTQQSSPQYACRPFLYLENGPAEPQLCVFGAVCNPTMLRKTSGVMFADRAGAGVLRWMGWDEQQAFAYTWAAREMIQRRS